MTNDDTMTVIDADRAVSTPERIREAALNRFATIGYGGTSVREIARAAGIEVSGLYNHFESKEAILWAIIDRAMREIANAQNDLSTSSGSVEARFRRFVRTHVDWQARYAREARIANVQLYSLAPAHFRQASDFRRRYARHLEDLVIEGREEGVFDVPNPRITAFAILQMGSGVANWYRTEGPISLPELCDHYELLAVRMVTNPA